MKNKGALQKLLGFMPKMKRPLSTKKPSQIPADPIPHIFQAKELEGMEVVYQLDVNVNALRSIMAGNSDFVVRKFSIGPNGDTQAAIVYLDGMTDADMINKSIMKPLMTNQNLSGNGKGGGIPFEQVLNAMLAASDVRIADDYKAILGGVLYGDAAVFIDKHKKCLLVSVKGFNYRSISEPLSEGVVRGPREGFVENLRTNTAMVRRRVQSPNLIIESMTIGRISNTSVAIGYIRGLADPKLVAEAKKRLARIEIDGVLESGYIEELIEDNPYSPFPQIIHTERPDKVADALMSGRVAIFTDNTPFVLVIPGEFVSFLQASEDYYERFLIGTFIRILRYTALGVSLVLPSLYIAITTFHQEMIPTPLLIRIAASREGVPFPALVEALLMEFSFEALREAGLRLPRPVGQAVSIVGALVVGEAAVSAGIVSPLMVIVVAVTGIASFVNPAFNMSIAMRILRFPMMLLAGTLGLFGIMVGLMVILVHMAGLRSFGVPYLAPFAPVDQSGLKDTVVRAPLWAYNRRPEQLSKDNPYRQLPDLKPGPWQNKLSDQHQEVDKKTEDDKSAWQGERQRHYETMNTRRDQQTEGQNEEADKSQTGTKKRRSHRRHKSK
ncbi:spore germination protein [Peptococcaceae bacterium 1198_IL3148]